VAIVDEARARFDAIVGSRWLVPIGLPLLVLLSLFLGVAGTYRKNDTVDVVYADGGNRRVVTLAPHAPRTP